MQKRDVKILQNKKNHAGSLLLSLSLSQVVVVAAAAVFFF
jgi:hypothetical protein